MNSPVILTSHLNVMIPIIKVVGDFCNLRCRYCFYNSKNQNARHVMNMELLERFLVEYMHLFTGNLIFIWHGGEPLLAGLSFFEQVIRIQRENLRNNQRIQNRIQTDATLIGDAWAEFFRLHDFKVGVSLDGNKESHNLFRINQIGRGSFDQTMNGILTLRRHNVNPGFIQTLTRDNLVRSRENLDFFVNQLKSKSWGTNIYLDIQEINKSMRKQNITNSELIQLLKDYIDFWLRQNNPHLQIREIENFISGIFRKRAPNCAFNGSCTAFFCLNYDGKIYPCDRFSDNSVFLFGDISRQTLLEILNGQKRLKYAESVNYLPEECTTCKWQKACNNGCSHHRLGGIQGKYYYCEARKEIFEYLKKKLSLMGYVL